MIIKPIRKFLETVTVIFLISSITGCSTMFRPLPSPTATTTITAKPTDTPLPSSTSTPTLISTPTQTSTPTKKPSPTKTNTFTPEPSATFTPLPPVPTSSFVNNQSAMIIGDECRVVIDGLYALKKDLGLPKHFTSENPFRQETDFDLNQYFQVLTHLKITSGYKLDYVYFNDELGGLPLVYARKSSDAPYQSYSELLQFYGEEISGDRSYGELLHKYDYLEQIRIDKSPESYFEFVTLAFLGDQFYLWWHGLYNDAKILCDNSDMSYVDEEMAGFDIEFPPNVKDRLAQIDFMPVVLVDETKVTVRFVAFTKWGGFFENVYVMDKENPIQLLDVQFNPLIEYDCGINF